MFDLIQNCFQPEVKQMDDVNQNFQLSELTVLKIVQSVIQIFQNFLLRSQIFHL